MTRKTIESKPWSGRFRFNTDTLAEKFNASISFDVRLYHHDIMGSIAHVRMLSKTGIITNQEAEDIVSGLRDIENEIESGEFEFTIDMEDIHMAIEKRLVEKIGTTGGKLHTGRSRNDQVALDMRLYLKDEITDILDLTGKLRKTIVVLARTNIDLIMPGYTHLQRAQPVLFSHHILAYYEMLLRDCDRLTDCLKRVNIMPLGAGALAGSPYPVDRGFIAKKLGFDSVTENSLDSVADRDFCIEFLGIAAILMMHLSRLGEELVLWSSQEFAFVELSDAFSTGSSIMPQKKNPDIPELIRGKCGRVYGNLVSLLTVMKSLPLAYDKDMQEDKEPVFDTIDTLKSSLALLPPMLETMHLNRKNMLESTKKGFLTATDAADYLVGKGVPFRDAHRIVGKIVAHCIDNEKDLEDLTMDEWNNFSDKFSHGIMEVVSVQNSIDSRDVMGGTALKRVVKRIREIGRMEGI